MVLKSDHYHNHPKPQLPNSKKFQTHFTKIRADSKNVELSYLFNI